MKPLHFLPKASVGRVHTQHRWSASANFLSRNALTATAASTAWPTANKAYHVPIRIYEWLKIDTFFVLNGGTAAGNVDIGIYDQNNALVRATGSTAQAGTNVVQEIAVTEFVLKPGFYRLALALSLATGTVFAQSLVNADNTFPYNISEEAAALPLPSTATPVTVTTGFIVPVFGCIRSGI